MSDDLGTPRAFRLSSAAIEAAADTSDEAVLAQEPEPALTLEVSLAAKLSLADFQNAVPLLRELALVSTLTDDTGQLELSLMSTPAFVKPKTWRLESVRAGDRYRIALAESVVSAAATDDENLLLMARELGISRLRTSSRGRLDDALKQFRTRQ